MPGEEEKIMMKRTLLILLCGTMVACAADADPTGDADPAEGADPTGEVETELVVSPLSTHRFFAGAGNGVVIRVADTGHTGFVPGFTVYDPAGLRVTSAWGYDVAGTSFQASATGTYSMTVYDNTNPLAIGAVYALHLAVAPGANTGGSLIPGGVVPGHINLGELDSYTFSAAAGEAILLRLTDVAGGALVPTFKLYDAAGQFVNWARANDVAGLDLAAPSTGTYTLVVYDSSSGLATTGDYKLYFTKVPGASTGGSLSPGSVTLGHIDEGELDSYTFTAAAGEGILLRLTDVAGGALVPTFKLYDAAGQFVNWARANDVAGLDLAAPSTGTYTLVVYDSSSGLATTGDYKLYFTKVPGASTGGSLSPGSVTLGHIDEGELDSYTFTAAAGEGILLRLTDVAGGALVPTFKLYDAAGQFVNWARANDVAGLDLAAPSTGTYTLVVYDSSSGLATTGDYKLTYTRTQ
jgi:hypothetical protein